MVNYRYAAKSSNGQTVEGTIQAHTKGEAVAELRRQDLVVLRVEEGGKKGSKGAAKKGGGLNFEIKLFPTRPSATRIELVLFTRQLATMIGAGISLLEGLEVLAEQAETP